MTQEEKKLQNERDEKTAGFLKIGYSWLSELFNSITDKIVKALNKDIYKIHIDNQVETDLSKIEKSLDKIAAKDTKPIINVDANNFEFLKSIKKIEGIDGEKGEKGDKGDKGDQGEKGEKGDTGRDGKDGKQGKQGEQGMLGKDGKDGKDGKNGKDGKDGKPATSKEVIAALKKDMLDISHIKGLEQHLKVSRQRMYGVGPSGALTTVAHDSSITGDGTPGNPLRAVAGTGGGAPTIETPVGDVDGANTAYTITAATTHIILLNGVELEEGAGNDYTISGTTLTMLYAPETDSKLRHRYWI